MSSLSGSVPSMHLFGAVAISSEVSLVFDRTEAIHGEIFPTHASLPEVSLKMRPPRELSLGFGTIKASFWRCSDLLPESSPVFDRTEAIHGDIFPTYASLSGLYRNASPREFSLGFSTIKTSFWRCTKLLPEFSPVFDRTEAILWELFSTYASLPKISLEMRPPREFSLGYGTIKASFWRCIKFLPEVSPAFFFFFLKENLNVSRPSEHPSVRGGRKQKCQKF